MTNPPAGSKVRRNIQGHVIIADAAAVKELRRLSTVTLSHLFTQAKEHGTAAITINDDPWMLNRNSDHTFTLTPGNPHRFSL